MDGCWYPFIRPLAHIQSQYCMHMCDELHVPLRSTVRNNATFAFAAYQISDMALLVTATFGGAHALVQHPEIASAALLLSALYKSSQFPLTSLFARSMEGPTPASALGYAGLSAHVGVVLLTSTMPLWFGFDWARWALGSVGVFTSVYATLEAKTRADRKGAIANATSATVGLIYTILAMGYADLALALSLGHASFRMIQVLRAPNQILDWQRMRLAIGGQPLAKEVPDWLYSLCWSLRRVDSDFHLLHLVHQMSKVIHLPNMPRPWDLSRLQKVALTTGCLLVSGAPFTPVYREMEHDIMMLLTTNPEMAALVMAGQLGLSVVLMRFLFFNVLESRQFRAVVKKKKDVHVHESKTDHHQSHTHH